MGSLGTGTSVPTASMTLGIHYDYALYRETEFMNDADGVAFKTHTYSSPYEWGFDLIPDTFDFRIP